MGAEVYQPGRLMQFITKTIQARSALLGVQCSYPISRLSVTGKKHKGVLGDVIWEAVEEETAWTTLLRPSNTSKDITECSPKTIVFPSGSWSLQKANGPKTTLMGVCLRRLCAILISPKVMRKDSKEAFGTHMRRSIW